MQVGNDNNDRMLNRVRMQLQDVRTKPSQGKRSNRKMIFCKRSYITIKCNINKAEKCLLQMCVHLTTYTSKPIKRTHNKNLLILRELTIAHQHIKQHSARIKIEMLTTLTNTGVHTLKNHIQEYIKCLYSKAT